MYEQATVAYRAFQTGKWPLETQGQPDVLHLAGASNIFAQRRERSTADTTPGSTPSDSGVFTAIPEDAIHPALLQYMQVIQDGDAKVQYSSDLLDTDSSRNTMLSGGSSSGYGLGASTSAPAPHGMPSATCTNIGVPPAQPLPQVPADNQMWNNFESTQYPQMSYANAQNPTADRSPASNDLPRGSGVSGMPMGDARAGNELDFAGFMSDNMPGLTYDGMGIGWEAFFPGWHP